MRSPCKDTWLYDRATSSSANVSFDVAKADKLSQMCSHTCSPFFHIFLGKIVGIGGNEVKIFLKDKYSNDHPTVAQLKQS